MPRHGDLLPLLYASDPQVIACYLGDTSNCCQLSFIGRDKHATLFLGPVRGPWPRALVPPSVPSLHVTEAMAQMGQEWVLTSGPE